MKGSRRSKDSAVELTALHAARCRCGRPERAIDGNVEALGRNVQKKKTIIHAKSEKGSWEASRRRVMMSNNFFGSAISRDGSLIA
jgi:hypothetical protein